MATYPGTPIETTTDAPVTTTDPPVTTTQDPPVTTTPVDPTTTTRDTPPTTTTEPPPVSSTTTRDDPHTRPHPPTTTTTPYTTSYISTMTVTWTRVPRTTRDSSGRGTTIYVPVTTLIPTIIPDPNQAPPPPATVPTSVEAEDSGLSSGMIVLVSLGALMVVLAAAAGIFVFRLQRKRRRREDEQMKRDALLEAGAALPGGTVVDVDALAMGRVGGRKGSGNNGGGGGGGHDPRHGPEMAAVAGPMGDPRRQSSVEQFRHSRGTEFGAGGAAMFHRASVSTSSEGTGAIMMLDEYPASGGGGAGRNSGFLYDYYGYTQDPSAFHAHSPNNYQRQSYPLPPPRPAVAEESGYADGYGHGHGHDVGAGAGTSAAATAATAAAATTGAGASRSNTSVAVVAPVSAATPPLSPPTSRVLQPLSADGAGVGVSELDRQPSTVDHQQPVSTTTTTIDSVSPTLGQGSATTVTKTNTGNSSPPGGSGGRGTAATPTMVTTTATTSSSSGLPSRELLTSEILYYPTAVNNPHTEYVPMQPTGVYAPSAPSSPQLLQIGRTHIQDASGAVRGIDVDPSLLERFAKEENKRQDPHALIEHHP